MYQSKAAIRSAGIMGPLVAMIVIASGMIGVDISEDVAGLPENDCRCRRLRRHHRWHLSRHLGALARNPRKLGGVFKAKT